MAAQSLGDVSGPHLFEDAPTAVFLLDAAGACVRVNRTFTKLTGLTPAEASGSGWMRVFPEAERAQVAVELQALLSGRAKLRRELELDSPGGKVWLVCSVSPQSSPEGAPYLFAGWLADVTERKRGEAERAALIEKLRVSEEMYRSVQRLGRFAHWTIHPNDPRPEWSPEMFALWGRRPEDGAPLVDELYPRADPADRARVKASTERLLRGEPDEVEYRILGWDGVYRWLHARREAIRSAEGAVVQVVGVAQDVTWRHEALRDRAQRERFLFGLVQALPDPAFVHDGDRILFANAAIAALLGWDNPEEMIGVSTLSLVPASEHERKQARTRRALSGGNNPGIELPLLRRDGSACPAEVSSLAAEYDGKPAVLEMARDLSARRAAEEQRLVSDRAAALATLASGVAHEVNNPLAWLQSNIEMIGEGLAKLAGESASPALRELMTMAKEAREGSQRVKTIVRDLQTFASRGQGELVPQDPTDALELALRLVDQELRGRCKVVKKYQPAPLVTVDRAQLAQAFMNVLQNAAQAMAGGDPATSELRVSVGTAVDGSAQLELEDTGPGIPPENLPRVFEPFFSTKPVGSGTGLGLSVALNSIRAMGGTLTVRSDPGRGAVFRVVLPRAEDGVVAQEIAAIRESIPRVLVVDDDPLIGQSLRRLLGRDCEVVIAVSAAGALEAIEKNRDFALLLVDLVMPGADGMQLFNALQVRAPELAARVVFMTGGAVSRRERVFLDDGPRTLVAKPFQAARVRALVRDAIRAASGAPLGPRGS